METDLGCLRCRLSKGRTQVVPPDGDLFSPVCFVGEGPGEKEDMLGRPFVGRAGQMLSRLMMEEGLQRARVMITNAVKCRPPGNRAPRRDEMAACFSYLEQELEGRRLVVAMGRSACLDLLGRDVRLADEANVVRHVRVGCEEMDLLPAYHPSACLFNLRARESLAGSIRIAKKYVDGEV